ncbi:hypothetical protein HD806DRAFT_534536 [Xylariaceae sp. AK1471]|nr:hypothetical protein HD806DRAFT_534536 [Xylariaceae sp. AK1471]
MAQRNEKIGAGVAEFTVERGVDIVETNNFRKVLENYDSCGLMIHGMTTRMEIECQICMCMNLALVNRVFDDPVPATHEEYTVLPRCGHAFGHSCLNHWIRTQQGIPKCPSCRTPVYCERRHVLPLKAYGDTRRNVADEINEIRAAIEKSSCERCAAQPLRPSRPVSTDSPFLPYGWNGPFQPPLGWYGWGLVQFQEQERMRNEARRHEHWVEYPEPMYWNGIQRMEETLAALGVRQRERTRQRNRALQETLWAEYHDWMPSFMPESREREMRDETTR